MKEKNSLLVKLVIFSVIEGRLKVFLPEGRLLGGFLKKGESLEETARGILKKLVAFSVKNVYLEQLYTFSYPDENRTEVLTAYYALVADFKTVDDKKISWVDCYNLSSIALSVADFKIFKYALQRLRWKIEYTNVVYSLLGKEFTFSELQAIYEAILDRKLDKRNFRKKILSLNILKSTGKKKKSGKARPAEIFCFRKRKLEFVEVL